ncbi:MAG: hypothetical protein RR263_00690, partial [Oscillospiraceae bacterium]
MANKAGNSTTRVNITILDSNVDLKAKIDAITDNIATHKYTYAEKAQINTAWAAYTALSVKDKTNMDKDTARVTKLTAAHSFIAERDVAIAVVNTAINSLPATITYADKAVVDKAKSDYEALYSDAEKTAVTYYTAKITPALATIADRQKAIDAVNTAINGLPATITYANKASVATARTGYDALTTEEKAAVTNSATLTAAETIITDRQKAIDAVDTAISQLPATITYDNKAAVEAARTNYDALTTEEKAAVTNYATLTNAETIISARTTEITRVQGLITALKGTSAAESDRTACTDARAAYNALSDSERNGMDTTNLTATETKLTLRTININITGSGTVVASPSSVLNKESSTLTITPSLGSTVTVATVDGKSILSSLKVGEASTYTISNIEKDQVVNVTFTKISYKVTLTQATGGKITADKTTVEYGDPVTITVITDPSYDETQTKVTVEGRAVTLDANHQYVQSNVTEDLQASAEYKIKTFGITTSTDTNGKITASDTAKPYGSAFAVTMTPNDGYKIATVTLDGADIKAAVTIDPNTNVGTYTVSNIQAAHNVAVTYEPIIYNVTVKLVNATFTGNEKTKIISNVKYNDINVLDEAVTIPTGFVYDQADTAVTATVALGKLTLPNTIKSATTITLYFKADPAVQLPSTATETTATPDTNGKLNLSGGEQIKEAHLTTQIEAVKATGKPTITVETAKGSVVIPTTVVPTAALTEFISLLNQADSVVQAETYYKISQQTG